jgi:hypothetical protein
MDSLHLPHTHSTMRTALALGLAVLLTASGASCFAHGSAPNVGQASVQAVCGRNLTLAGKTIAVPPLGVKAVVDEPLKFALDVFGQPLGVPAQCQGNRLLRMGVAGVLVPGSLALKTSKDGKAATLVKNKDYLLTEDTGVLRLPFNSAIKTNQVVYASYKIQQQRADLIVQSPKGSVRLIPGQPAAWSPEPPSAPAGETAVGVVYSNSKNLLLSKADYFPISGTKFDYSSEVRTNAPLLSKSLSKLRNGQPIKIVFWGDSITLGSGSTREDKSFVAEVLQLF